MSHKVYKPLPSSEDFLQAAKPLKLSLKGEKCEYEGQAKPKVFSSGAYGWSCSASQKRGEDGQRWDVMITLNVVVKGSKPQDVTDEDEAEKRPSKKRKH